MIWILVVIILIILLVIYIKFRKHKKNTILCYGGGNGTGKTFNMTADALRGLRKARRNWRAVNKPTIQWLWLWIPYFNKKRKNKENYGLAMPLLYSTYPIKISKKELSVNLTNDIMFLEKTIPLNSQVVIDEFSGWISQFEYKEAFSDTLNDHLQKFRHYHGNLSHFYCADQCTNNIPLQVRYRCNSAIICQETRHFLFIHITKYKMIELTDDIKSVEILDNDNADTDDKTLKMLTFQFGRVYDDRAYSNRYTYVDDNTKNYKFSTSILKVDKTLTKPLKNKKYVNLDVVIEKRQSEKKSQL